MIIVQEQSIVPICTRSRKNSYSIVIFKLVLVALQNGCILDLVIVFDRLFSFLIKRRYCSLLSSAVKKLKHLTIQ